MTAGPAFGTASPRTTKMPVPRVAPMLIMVSCHRPRERRSAAALALAALGDQAFHRLAAHQARAEAPDGGADRLR